MQRASASVRGACSAVTQTSCLPSPLANTHSPPRSVGRTQGCRSRSSKGAGAGGAYGSFYIACVRNFRGSTRPVPSRSLTTSLGPFRGVPSFYGSVLAGSKRWATPAGRSASSTALLMPPCLKGFRSVSTQDSGRRMRPGAVPRVVRSVQDRRLVA